MDSEKEITILEGRVYPIKGCRPVIYGPDEDIVISGKGPKGDRRLTVVTADGKYVSLKKYKEYQKLALVQPILLDKNAILITADTRRNLQLDISKTGKPELTVEVLGDKVQAVEYEEGSKWFSEFLDKEVKLVGKNGKRTMNRAYTKEDPEIRFADRNPIHAISQATIDALNKELKKHRLSVSADNFRPNLVLGGCEDREENNMEELLIGEKVFLQSTIPCERCAVPAVDPFTGEYNQKLFELLKELRKPHHNKPPIIGEQYQIASTGTIRIGEKILVRKWRKNGYTRDFNSQKKRAA